MQQPNWQMRRHGSGLDYSIGLGHLLQGQFEGSPLPAIRAFTNPGGNVTLTVGDIVITAEEAVVENGEIQLTANARVRLRAK